MSPSRLADALACLGRVRTDASEDRARREGRRLRPAARIGLLCHRAFELHFGGDRLGLPQAWNLALKWQEGEAARSGALEAFRTAAPRVTLDLQYLRLARAAERVRARLEVGDETSTEVELEARDGSIAGVADIIVRGRSHWIGDLKSGAIRDADTGDPRSDYAHQLMLYAYMEAEKQGDWPTHGWLITLHGQDVRVEFDRSACENVAKLASTTAQRLHRGDRELTPSLEACRWCERLPSCDAPWDDEAIWGDLYAARLKITSLQQRGGEIWFEATVDDGLEDPARPARFRRVSLAHHPEAEKLCEGAVAVVIGARWSDHSEAWHLGPGSRIEVTGVM